jgi:hypothetical protein
MANRFPLVIDTTDGNKLKELPAGDNLDLRENSIVRVQDIDALGTINAADVTVNGNRLVAQNFIDLTDTPENYVDSANKFVKVNATGDGLEFRPFSDIGNIEVEEIEVGTRIVPATTGTVNIGTDELYFNTVVANEFKGDLIAGDDTRVFDAGTGKISYAALQGAPTQISEFNNDVGYLLAADLDSSLAGLFDEGATFNTDIKGSVFGDDSTVLVDGTSSEIVGDVNNQIVITVNLESNTITALLVSSDQFTGPIDNNTIINAQSNYDVIIGEENTRSTIIVNGQANGFEFESGTGIAEYSASTDLIIRAGNRIRFADTPVRFSQLTDTEAGYIVAQNGDVIYNTTQNRLQIRQNGAWIDLHKGQFDGNVVTATGESNFNDVVITGDLTVQGTTTSVETTNTTITDNIITLNNGESGAGVTSGSSGIEIDRGSSADVSFVFDETGDKWTTGSTPLETTDISSSSGGSINDFASIQGDSTGDITQFVNVTGTGAGTISSFTNITGSSGGTISGFTTLTGDSGGTISGFTNITGDSGGTISGFTTLTGDSGGTISGFTSITGDSGGTISGFTTLTGDSGGDISQFTNIIGDSGGTISQFTNIIGDSGGTISQFTDITGDSGGTISQFTNIVGDSGGDITQFTNITGDGGGTVSGFNFTGDLTGDVSGNVTGNIDNPALTVGASATTIAIGNGTSTTTINGDLQLNNALIVNNLIADDSISITTATGDGNAISLGPLGTNTAINLTANSIRLFGPVTTSIVAQGGIVGDLKGSVAADDSTVLINSADGIIYKANIEDSANWDTAFSWGNHATAGYITSGGSFTGDVKGSVFADDSSVMVNAIDFTMAADVLTLTPLNAEPIGPVNGMVAVADGTGWDPHSTGVQTMTVYLGGAWRQIAAAV